MHCPEACRVGITVKNGVSSLDLNVHLQKHTCFVTSAAVTLGNSQNFRGAQKQISESKTQTLKQIIVLVIYRPMWKEMCFCHKVAGAQESKSLNHVTII
jgi:hypothetical protein